MVQSTGEDHEALLYFFPQENKKFTFSKVKQRHDQETMTLVGGFCLLDLQTASQPEPSCSPHRETQAACRT